MNNHEKQLQDFFRSIQLNDTPNPQHRDALEQRLLESLPKTPSLYARSRIMLAHHKITRIAVAAVIGMVLIVPLTYGTSALVKRLTRGSYACDEFTGPFRLGSDIHIGLETGTKTQPTIASLDSIRFFIEDGQIRGTLRCSARIWPKHKWRTQVEMLDGQGKVLRRTECVTANAGIERDDFSRQFTQSIHIALGTADGISDALQCRVRLLEASQSEPVTPAPWVYSNILSVVYGQVTDANGAPMMGAEIQIRQNRRPGQTSIDTRDVLTDVNGFYLCDGLNWPYRVGALIREATPSGKGYRHQYRRLNEVITGTQRIDISFTPFPSGSATLAGIAKDPNGAIWREFIVDARLDVDWDDDSNKYLHTYGHQEPFVTSDGRFEIRGLPEGHYRVYIRPTARSRVQIGLARSQSYTCQLHEGQETIVGQDNATRKLWYGRVQFEDGTPAIADFPKYATQVIAWGSDHATGFTLGTVDNSGYFGIQIRDKGIEQFASGQAWLRVAIAETNHMHGIEEGPKFPFDLLSLDRDKAAVVTIKQPQVYYGRILYEDGRPAVLPAAPWSGAKVRLRLDDLEVRSRRPFITGPFFYPDDEGYFKAYLSNELRQRIQDGRIEMKIMHPSYTEERVSKPIGAYPADKLARDKGNVTAHTLAFIEMSEDLKRYLDSAYELKALATTLKRYAGKHDGHYPRALSQLESEITETAPSIENVEYFFPGVVTTILSPEETVLAYDAAMLNETETTHVLFLDGHLEFCRPRQLRVLGIQRDAAPPK